jgi:hypothetical protein
VIKSIKNEVELALCMCWRHIEVVDVELHSFLTLALDGGEWSTSYPGSVL